MKQASGRSPADDPKRPAAVQAAPSARPAVQAAPRAETEAERLRFGQELLGDVRAAIERGEDLDDLLVEALGQWGGEALVMAHQEDPERSAVWMDAWTQMDQAVTSAIARDANHRAMLAELEQWDPEARAAYQADYERAREQVTGYFYPPAKADFVPGDLPVSMGETPFALDPAALRTSSILTAPLEEREDGSLVVTDHEGMEWDISEHLADLNRPEIREQLRQSLQGLIPSHPTVAHTVGAFPMLQLAIEGAAAIGVGENVRNVRTADPRQRLPWLVGLGPGGSMRGDEEELARDPAWTRALIETIETLDVKPTGWETFGHAMAGLADFMIFHKVAAGTLKLAGKAGAAVLPEGSLVRGAAGRMALGRVPGSTIPPFNTRMAHTVAGFAGYEATANATNPELTFTENLWHGATQGLLFSGFGALARGGRGILTAAAGKVGAGSLLKQLVPKALEKPVARLVTAQPAHSTNILEGVRRFSEKTLSKTIEKLTLAPAAKQAIQHSVDAYWTGVFVHSFGEAQAAPEGQGFKTFWASLLSPQSQATGFAFALSGALQYGAIVRPAVQDYLASEEGKVGMQRVARALGQPGAEQDLRKAFDLFRRWQEAEPELFNRAEFQSPAKQRAREGAAVLAMEQRITDARAAFEEMRADDAAAAGKPLQLTLGEFNPARLEMLGFRAKTDGGRMKHALNAVNEYLREIEGATSDPYYRLADVPVPTFNRMLDWRDRGKPARHELTLEPIPGNEYRPEPPRREPRQDELQLARARQGELRPLEGNEFAPDPPRRPVGQGELREIEGNEYRPPRPARDRRAPTLEEAAEIARRREGMPGTEGKSALEIVAEETRRPKRPSLGRAIAQVLSGKRDAEWLKAAFPEGAAAIGEGPAEGWVGAFERATKAAWKEARIGRLAEINKARAAEREEFPRLQDFVRQHGGLRYEADLEHLTTKEGGGRGKRPLVHRKGSEKGMRLDDLGEKAWEAGYFTERPDLRELAEALEQDIPNLATVRHAREFREHEAELARMHAAQLDAAREGFESGEIQLPSEPAERRRMIVEVFGSDERFIGMAPEQLEREILALRAQRASGDPGPAAEAPMRTAEDFAMRSAAVARQLVEDLQGLDMLSLDVTAHSPEAIEATMRLVRGEPAPEGVDPAIWGRLRASAVEVRDTMREALRRSMEGTWDEAGLRELEDVWAWIDAEHRGEPIAPELRERLKEWVDEDGSLKTGYLDRLQQDASTKLWNIVRAKEQEGEVGFYSGIPLIAFTGRKFTNVEENLAGRLLSWGTWLDGPRAQRILAKGTWQRRVFDFVTRALSTPIQPVLNRGPLSRPQATRSRRNMETFLAQLGHERGIQEVRRMVAQWIAAELTRPWGGSRPPQGDLDFFTRGMDTGAFAKARGREDFEAMRPGSGYMWPIFEKTRDLFEELGRDMVNLGLLTVEQFEKFGGGKYLSHYYVRQQIEDDSIELGRGRIPVKHQGRSMLREDGVLHPEEPVMRIRDPAYALTRGVFEESQTVRVFQTLRTVANRLGEWVMTERQVAQLGAFDRSDMIPAAVRVVPEKGEGLFDAIRRMRRSGHAETALIMGARLQTALEQMAKPGEAPKPGQVPYTKQREDLLKFFLGEGKDGRIFIPKPMAEELQIQLSDVFGIPGESRGAKFAAVVDSLMQFTKRGLTIMRPANWTLTILGNVERNHVLGGVSRWDFMAGVAGLPSFTGDGIRGARLYLRWIKEGLPKTRPEGWADKDWRDMRSAARFLELAGPSSNVFVSLGPEVANSLGESLPSPQATRAAWELQLDHLARQGGWSLDARDRLSLAARAMTDRMHRGLEKLDTQILAWLGEGDPIGRARAIGSMSAAYNLTDLFLFKYPAYLKAKHEWPDLPTPRVLAYALGKTGNAADTHPALRRFMSMHLPWNDRVWKAAQKSDAHAYAKLLGAQLLRHRFWIDPVTMMPQGIRALVRHPIRSFGSAAIYAGVGALIMASLSDDERARFEEESATAKRSVTRWPALSDKNEEALKAFGQKVGLSVIPDSWQSAASKFWRQLTLRDPFAVPMPKHGGESRIGSFAELTPPGMVLNRARGAVSVAKGAAGLVGIGETTTREDVEALGTGADRMLGIQAQIGFGLISGAINGDTDLVAALGGRGSTSEALATALFKIAGTAGVMYPTLGMFTPEGQFIGENVALGGQRWNEWARGVLRAHNPEDPAQHLGSSAARLLWPSRSMYQRPPLASPVDAWTQALAEMYGPGFSPSSEEGRAKMRAHRWVTSQMSVLLGDLYEQHFDEQGEPGAAEVTLDERVAGALVELAEHTVPIGLGRFGIEPGYEPKGTLLRGIAALPEEERSPAIEHLTAWVTRERFQEDGMGLLLEAGRRLQMPKALFREAMRHALEDPSGTGLVSWWWSQAKDADEDTLGFLAPLAWDTQIPPKGTQAEKDYLSLMARYTNAGMQWPPTPFESPDQVYVEEGVAPAVHGAPAFRRVLGQRPQNPLEGLLLNPR